MSDTREANTDPYADARERMVCDQLIARGIKDPAVLRTFRNVPRHRFVKPGMRRQAYSDRPLPTEHSQTISQPYIVALMTEALDVRQTTKVLEIGTGSGYQTAILAQLSEHVFTIERLPSLATGASERLRKLGYTNFSPREGDGSLGWPEQAPFDRIIVTAAAPEPPQPLLDQLADGGKMVIPIGPPLQQELTLISKSGDTIDRTSLCSCIFVKLVGDASWKR